MRKNNIITLTTDFGEGSYYVGSMKGAILAVNPDSRIVDITHSVPQGDVLSAAFVVLSAYPYFPAGTVHTIVVDPGVGSFRSIIAAKAGGHLFLAPDNGVLSLVLQREKADALHRVVNKRYFLKRISSTFHGRDIFAPAAAHLSKGVSLSKLGPAATGAKALEVPQPRIKHDCVEGCIIYIDSFGGCASNISRDYLGGKSDFSAAAVIIKNRKINGISDFYAEKKKGALLALFGSSGFLEVAVVGGSAAKKLNIKQFCPVRIDLVQAT